MMGMGERFEDESKEDDSIDMIQLDDDLLSSIV